MQVRRSLLMPYPAESMFDLIEHAEHYPQFIPWCTDAVILERTDEIVAARLSMRVAGLTLSLQTRNPKRRPEWTWCSNTTSAGRAAASGTASSKTRPALCTRGRTSRPPPLS
jgi:ribosome-associated toxin RatA of RatAB toxin-antitoxin module